MLSLAEIASTDLSRSRFDKQTLYLSWNIKYPDITNDYTMRILDYRIEIYFVYIIMCMNTLHFD